MHDASCGSLPYASTSSELHDGSPRSRRRRRRPPLGRGRYSTQYSAQDRACAGADSGHPTPQWRGRRTSRRRRRSPSDQSPHAAVDRRAVGVGARHAHRRTRCATQIGQFSARERTDARQPKNLGVSIRSASARRCSRRSCRRSSGRAARVDRRRVVVGQEVDVERVLADPVRADELRRRRCGRGRRAVLGGRGGGRAASGSAGASQPGPRAIVGSDDGCERTATLYAWPIRGVGAREDRRRRGSPPCAGGLPAAMDGRAETGRRGRRGPSASKGGRRPHRTRWCRGGRRGGAASYIDGDAGDVVEPPCSESPIARSRWSGARRPTRQLGALRHPRRRRGAAQRVRTHAS